MEKYFNIILLLASDRIDILFEMMLKVLSAYGQDELLDSLVLISNRFSHLKKDEKDGFISKEDYRVERARIIAAFIAFITENKAFLSSLEFPIDINEPFEKFRRLKKKLSYFFFSTSILGLFLAYSVFAKSSSPSTITSPVEIVNSSSEQRNTSLNLPESDKPLQVEVKVIKNDTNPFAEPLNKLPYPMRVYKK